MEYKSPFVLSRNLASAQGIGRFYTMVTRLVQHQIYLIARLEQALSNPDLNKMRALRGQFTINTYSVESFLKRQYPNRKTLCSAKGEVSQQSSLPMQLTESQSQIYCSLYTSNQELLKLSPVIDQLFSRRGELALVRPLPLVSGQRNSDQVLSVAPVQRPDLGRVATHFISREPNITPSPVPVVGYDKRAIINYVAPIQPAIGVPDETISTLKTADQMLKAAQVGFPRNTKFMSPQTDSPILDRFAYDIDPQEKQIYAQFLALPYTGIFQVLPDSTYRHQRKYSPK